MSNYNIKYTDNTKPTIDIVEGDVNNTTTDIHLFGRTKLEYGQELNENLLHLLENFAAPELTGSSEFSSNPDFLNATYNKLLSHPIKGELWFNTTRKRFYFWNGANWFPISNRDDYAANWGLIADGYPLPKPVSSSTGRVFEYNECIWSVAPANINGKVDYTVWATDANANVVAKYRYSGSSDLHPGVVNYLIIGIAGNVNQGTSVSPPIPTPTPTPAVTPSATFDPMVTPSPTASVTPTVTVTPTLTASVTPTVTVTPTPSRSFNATPAPTNTQTPGPTPTNTPNPTVTRTPAVTPTQTPPGTPAITPSSVAQLRATFTNGKSSSDPTNSPPFGASLDSLESYCDVALHNSITNAYNCSGQLVSCSSGRCAPKPGDITTGPELRVTVSGGLPPYSVTFKNWSGSFSPSTSHCFTLFAVGDTVPINTNSAGSITTSPTFTKTINTSGGTSGNYAIVGQCGIQEIQGNGTFEILVIDSQGTTITKTMSWSVSRINTSL